jgi:hypothetical protein
MRATHACIPAECPECSVDLALLTASGDPIATAADLRWAADYLTSVAPTIDADLLPTARQIQDWLVRGGRELVIAELVSRTGVSQARRELTARTGGAA